MCDQRFMSSVFVCWRAYRQKETWWKVRRSLEPHQGSLTPAFGGYVLKWHRQYGQSPAGLCCRAHTQDEGDGAYNINCLRLNHTLSPSDSNEEALLSSRWSARLNNLPCLNIKENATKKRTSSIRWKSVHIFYTSISSCARCSNIFLFIINL